MRWLAFVLFASIAFAQSDVDAELAKAAKSPYDLARFVDSHQEFDVAALWKALGAKSLLAGPRCRFTEELISVVNPFQVIVHLHDIRRNFVMSIFVIGVRAERRNEHVAIRGAVCKRGQRYYEPHQEVRHIGPKPYFLATEQGVSGSDWGSQIENWFDLTLPTFEPVLRLTKTYHYSGSPARIGYEAIAMLVGELVNAPDERINLTYQVTFQAYGWLDVQELQVVYSRRGSKFVFDSALSKIPKRDLDAALFYDERLVAVGSGFPADADRAAEAPRVGTENRTARLAHALPR